MLYSQIMQKERFATKKYIISTTTIGNSNVRISVKIF